MTGSAAGTPGALHPRTAANSIGLTVPGGPITWTVVLDAAVEAYWSARPAGDRRALAAWRRRQARQRITPEQWIRRAGAA